MYTPHNSPICYYTSSPLILTIQTNLSQQKRLAGKHWQIFLFLILFLFTIATSTFCMAGSAGADKSDQTNHILILNSYNQGFRWTDDIVAAITSTMSARLHKIDFNIEYMDSKRYLDKHFNDLLLQSLALKYQRLQPDIIITSDDDALDFIKRHHQKLFPNVPVIFCGVNNVTDAFSVDREYFAGLVETLDVSANIDLARNLLPKINEIVIVSDGTPTGIGTRKMAVDAQQDYPDLTFTYLNGEELGTDQMLARLHQLKTTSAVIAPAWYLDKDGNTFDNKAIYPRIAAASPVPVFGTSSANLGLGIIGGKVNSGSIQGEYSAKQALRILSGEATTKDLPIETGSQNRYMFDYQQLIHFAIDLHRLPPGAIILNQPISFYARYKTEANIAVAAFLTLLVIIVLLMWNIRRRKQAEHDLFNQKQIAEQYLDIAEVILVAFDNQARITLINRKGHEVLGYDEGELFSKDWFRICLPPEEYEQVFSVYKRLIAGEVEPFNYYENQVLTKTGKKRLIAWNNVLLKDNAGCIVGTLSCGEDITENKQAEEKLLYSISLTNAALESTPNGILIVKDDGKIARWNQKFIDLFQVAQELLDTTIKDPILEYVAAQMADPEAFLTKVKELYSHKDASSEDLLHLADGRIIERYSQPLKIGEEIVGRFWSFRDITELKQAEEVTANSNKLLQTIINTAPMRIFFKDKELRYLGCNNSFAQDAGVGHPEDLIGKDDYQLVWKEHAELYRMDDLNVIESGAPKLSYEELQTTSDGRKIWVRTSKVPLRDESDEIIGVLGMYEDITAYQQAKEDLRNLRITLEAAFQQTPVPMTLISMPDTVIRIVNSACLDFLGVTDEPTPVGQRLVDFKPSYKDYDADGNLTPLVEAPLAKVITGGIRTLNQERRIERKDGTSRWALVNANPICNSEGVFIAALLVFPDITEQKNAEEERRKLQNQLIQAQKIESVGQLAGGVAHDFNNMLGVILGHAEIAMEYLDPAQPLYTDLEEIRMAATRSADLTRQLLAFARKQTIAPKVLDLNETIEGLLKMLRRLIGENIDLIWQPGSGLWSIKMDPSQIDQILANLFVNARDAISGVGKITIETRNSTIDEEYCASYVDFLPGEYVLITVSDNGSGIDGETLSHIFEPFFTTKSIGKGTGLGLSTVYGAVRQNKGFINVYSEPERGTIFTIYLPRYIDECESGKLSKEDLVKPSLGGHETILLVEDEPAILNMSKILLQLLGYSVLTASTPNDAIRLAREITGKIHLLITDVIMPDMNGRDLAKKILDIQKETKCLFMSGYTSDIIANQGMLDEGVNFIQKPFMKNELAEMVRKALKT